MRTTTFELLRLLQAAAPSQVFNVRPATSETGDDVIQLANNHSLLVDGQFDPPMVCLMGGCGQIEFWMVRSKDVLHRVLLSALAV